jgi:hypothetical protein
MGKDFPTDSPFFLDGFFLLIALDNFEAAKALVELAPSWGPHCCRPGMPKGFLEVPAIPLGIMVN